jgi:glycosyltransferase involved in cell wall biosynthesis
MEPKVSICCITYNHEKYIRDAIEGFLSQKTTFPIEVIIHDDASTDGTTNIIKEYADKYPNLIVPILQSENQLSKGLRPSPTYVWPRARGKYIALCEGDDFWTDPLKLQKQVDFLEAHEDCSWCFHASTVVDEKTKLTKTMMRPKQIPRNGKFTIKDVITVGGGFYATASSMFRTASIINIPEWFFNAPVGDFPLALIASCYGDIGYIDSSMCVYRKNVPGSWTEKTFKDYEHRWENSLNYCIKTEQYLNDFNSFTNFKYNKYVNNKILHKRCELFLLAFYLPYKGNMLNNRFERLRHFKMPHDIFSILKFIMYLCYYAISATIRKTQNIALL